jgi:hypothetical protein
MDTVHTTEGHSFKKYVAHLKGLERILIGSGICFALKAADYITRSYVRTRKLTC